MKLSDVLTEERWFQADAGRTKPIRVAATLRAGDEAGACLLVALYEMTPGEKLNECRALADVCRRLFPERVGDARWPSEIIVHVNNHDDTEWSDIEKIIHTFEMEEG